MKEVINNNQPLNESLNNRKSKDLATEVFNKILAQHKRPKNPFDVLRTTTYPSLVELKLGGNPNDSV